MLTLGTGLRAGSIEWKPQAEPRCIPSRRGFFVFTVAAKSQ